MDLNNGVKNQRPRRSLRALFCGHKKYWFRAQSDEPVAGESEEVKRTIFGECRQCRSEVIQEVTIKPS